MLIQALWLVRRRLSAVVEAASAGEWQQVQETSKQTSTRLMELLDVRMDLSGCEHIDPEEQYVVVALHESFMDVIALLQLPLDLAWVARDELMGTPGLHAALDGNLAVTISPEQPRTALRQLIRSAPGIFSEGRSLAMFPQGTLLGIETAFSSGAFRIAERFGRPILPVVIAGTHNVYDYPFSPLVRFGQQIRVAILPPVAPGSHVDSVRELETQMRCNATNNHPLPRTYEPEHDGFWQDYAFEIAEEFPELRKRLAVYRRTAGAPHQLNRG